MEDLEYNPLTFISRSLPVPYKLESNIMDSYLGFKIGNENLYQDHLISELIYKEDRNKNEIGQEMFRVNRNHLVLPSLNSIQCKLNKVSEPEPEIIDISSDQESFTSSIWMPYKRKRTEHYMYNSSYEEINNHSIKVQTYIEFAKNHIQKMRNQKMILNYKGKLPVPNYKQGIAFDMNLAVNSALTQLKVDELKSNKGRKRKHNFECSTMKSLIEDEAVPQWIKYLNKKMKSNEDKETGVKPRDDTIWKKIFRDLREFFRILFKQRFHPLDYKSCEQADECCLILLRELGIDASHFTDYETRKMFYYFHQTRLNSSHHYMSDYVEKEGEVYPMDIIEKYKDSLKAQFMLDPVMSRLFYLLFSNFGSIYQSHLKPKYIGIVDTLIGECIKCYGNMREADDMVKIMKVIFKKIRTK